MIFFVGEDFFWLRTATSLSLLGFFHFFGKGGESISLPLHSLIIGPSFWSFLATPFVDSDYIRTYLCHFRLYFYLYEVFKTSPALPFASAFACFVSPVHSRRRQTAAKRTASISTTAVNIRHRHLDQVRKRGGSKHPKERGEPSKGN